MLIPVVSNSATGISVSLGQPERCTGIFYLQCIITNEYRYRNFGDVQRVPELATPRIPGARTYTVTVSETDSATGLPCAAARPSGYLRDWDRFAAPSLPTPTRCNLTRSSSRSLPPDSVLN